MSEIDDIFSSRAKAKIVQAVASTSSLPEKKKKHKDKKRKREPVDDPPASLSKSRPLPETVIDTSALVLNGKRQKTDRGGATAKAVQPSMKHPDRADESRFKDSRGSGPRKKTEEGWAIYKEDELGIRDEGGETPLCPFDCECCF
ncbi:Uncharacterized protein C6G9.01c [Hypsizygus marmoreus]|uniref:Uncharacterized protein C6G9.01c n=1 Tax=Hypsizygus marmoreus TaxID=39966 RepID=A0A369KAW9_HYPMA|nr:Uncharacterized protein C6G9.01c [Hypsizygus marmoreus]